MSGATGAAIGVGGAVAVGSGVGSYFAGQAQAGAAQDAASMQYDAALKQIAAEQQNAKLNHDYAVDARNTAVNLAAPSSSELAQMGINLQLQNQAMGLQMEALKRDQGLLDAVDPAIKEAGKQALELLQGKQAAAVQPFVDQRNLQKQKLEQTLADRLGPDYAQSSAGANALRAFDSDTAAQSNAIQQSTLAQVLGVAQNTSQALNPVTQTSNAFASLGSLNAYGIQAAQNVTNRQVNAFTGNQVAPSQAPNFNNLVTAAGNSSIGSILGYQNAGNAANTAGGLGGQLLGYGVQKGLGSGSSSWNYTGSEYQ